MHTKVSLILMDSNNNNVVITYISSYCRVSKPVPFNSYKRNEEKVRAHIWYPIWCHKGTGHFVFCRLLIPTCGSQLSKARRYHTGFVAEDEKHVQLYSMLFSAFVMLACLAPVELGGVSVEN